MWADASTPGVNLNSAATLGATLAPNATAWAAASDRQMKADVPVDGRETLEKVAALPISA